MRTTADSYNSLTGEVHDDLALWALTTLCDVLPGCVTPELYPTFFLQGVWMAPTDEYFVTFDEFF